jgi:hypothetical protein
MWRQDITEESNQQLWIVEPSLPTPRLLPQIMENLLRYCKRRILLKYKYWYICIYTLENNDDSRILNLFIVWGEIVQYLDAKMRQKFKYSSIW